MWWLKGRWEGGERERRGGGEGGGGEKGGGEGGGRRGEKGGEGGDSHAANVQGTYESGIGASQLVHSTVLVRASFGEFLKNNRSNKV